MIIDRDFLLETFDGDCAEASQVLVLLFDTAREQMLQMRIALQAGDRDLLKRGAHRISGSTATCGLFGINDRLRDLEARSHDEPLPALAAQVADIDTLLQKAEAESHRLFQSADEEASDE